MAETLRGQIATLAVDGLRHVEEMLLDMEAVDDLDCVWALQAATGLTSRVRADPSGGLPAVAAH